MNRVPFLSYRRAASEEELAAQYWHHAQELNPADWNYHRQEWSFEPRQDASKKWMDKFQKLERPYYPKLDIQPKPGTDKK